MRVPIGTLRRPAWLALAGALAACSSGGPSGDTTGSAPSLSDCAVAREASGPADLVPGPLARGRSGDFVLENGRIRTIVQKAGRNWFNIGQFGGNIIDAALKNADGNLATEDHYEEAALGTNLESSPNYQSVQVLDNGGPDGEGGCEPAVLRATGPDDLLDFVNGSSAIRDMGFMFPDSADDVDLPVTIQTDYILDADRRYVTMETRLINNSDEAQEIYMAEYLNGSGEVELFQYGYGFGEALLTAPCESCRVAIYAGHQGATGISYGIIHDFGNTSSLSVSGVTVPAYGTDAVPLVLAGPTAEPPPFTVPADGELLITRYFAVGDGTVASIMDVKHMILEEPTGVVTGRVTDANGPVANAEIAVLTEDSDFPPGRGPELIVADHFRTDARGRYRGTLRPGDYELRLNVPDRLAGTPPTANISVATDETVTQDFEAPLPARLRVHVVDGNGDPIPAKVQLIGTENSPDADEPLNSEDVAGGAVTVESGIYGDPFADPLPNGVVLSAFAVHDPREAGAVTVGDTGPLEIEPGDYQLSVSRGMRYSEHVQDVTLTEGQLTELTARLVRVVPTPDHVFGDFHVHAFNSPDSEVTNRERVASYLAEGIEFFTPSDHGMRVDFTPVIADMEVGEWAASAHNSENTTFDYGHFNAWPTAIDTSPANTDEPSQSPDPKISRGSIDWGRPEPPGEDFPSKGSYGLTPEEIFADGKAEPFIDGRETVMQINHIASHFGGSGLEIDTGQTPPQSGADPASKRLDPDSGNLFDDGFDTLEMWISTDGRTGQFDEFLGQNLGDWFNLLNQGIVKTLIADSDTHERRLTSLSARNVISVPESVLDDNDRADLEAIRTDPHDVGDEVIKGRSTGTNSLFLQVEAENAANNIGGLEVEDSFGPVSDPLPLNAPDETVTLHVSIKSPTWAEYNRIRVFVNSETQRKTDETGLQPAEPPRYEACAPTVELVEGADFTRETVDVTTIDGTTYQRFETDVDVSLPSPGEDYWIMVLAQGTDDETRPLWPVVPNDFSDSGDGLRTRSAADTGVIAMAATNPIFVDANGDGEWTAPGVRTHDGTPTDPCPGGDALAVPTTESNASRIAH